MENCIEIIIPKHYKIPKEFDESSAVNCLKLGSMSGGCDWGQWVGQWATAVSEVSG